MPLGFFFSESLRQLISHDSQTFPIIDTEMAKNYLKDGIFIFYCILLGLAQNSISLEAFKITNFLNNDRLSWI
ncbi:hypothetical protein DSM07_10385 [Oenococcus sp. UCMA 16435]|nr:hypothetical protein DSM07_10385 [Oenococcus sp. UCMA 16435]